MVLKDGCSVFEVSIYPPNWDTKKANVSEIWYINYRFRDPRFLDKYPQGKPVRIKAGINRLKTLKEKQGAVELLRDDIIAQLKSGYNPIIDVGEKFIESVPAFAISVKDEPVTMVEKSTPFIKALRFALTKSQNVKEAIADARSGLNSVEAAAIKLKFQNIPIHDIEIRHVKLCLDECILMFPNFSPKRFNKVKSYLTGLFNYLGELSVVTGNVVKAISPMKTTTDAPVVLTNDEIKLVKDHLYKYNRPFYKFMMMFYYSGGRMKEFMRLKGRNVDLVDQTYKVRVEKGPSRIVSRTIRNVALPFWKEQMENCGPDDYVFSRNLLPGVTPINSKQVSRRWTTHVKEPLGIKPTFYKLKHLNSDRTLAAAGAQMAAGQNGHLSTKMVEDIYAINEKKRIHEGLKALDIEL